MSGGALRALEAECERMCVEDNGELYRGRAGRLKVDGVGGSRVLPDDEDSRLGRKGVSIDEEEPDILARWLVLGLSPSFDGQLGRCDQVQSELGNRA